MDREKSVRGSNAPPRARRSRQGPPVRGGSWPSPRYDGKHRAVGRYQILTDYALHFIAGDAYLRSLIFVHHVEFSVGRQVLSEHLGPNRGGYQLESPPAQRVGLVTLHLVFRYTVARQGFKF